MKTATLARLHLNLTQDTLQRFCRNAETFDEAWRLSDDPCLLITIIAEALRVSHHVKSTVTLQDGLALLTELAEQFVIPVLPRDDPSGYYDEVTELLSACRCIAGIKPSTKQEQRIFRFSFPTSDLGHRLTAREQFVTSFFSCLHGFARCLDPNGRLKKPRTRQALTNALDNLRAAGCSLDLLCRSRDNPDRRLLHATRVISQQSAFTSQVVSRCLYANRTVRNRWHVSHNFLPVTWKPGDVTIVLNNKSDRALLATIDPPSKAFCERRGVCVRYRCIDKTSKLGRLYEVRCNQPFELSAIYNRRLTGNRPRQDHDQPSSPLD